MVPLSRPTQACRVEKHRASKGLRVRYVEHFNSSIIGAMSSITSRWALMAARGWARLILERHRDLVDDRPSRVAAAEAPLDEAQEHHHFDNPTNHSRGAFYHGEAA